MNYRVKMCDLPVSIKAFTITNSDGSYTIFINCKMSYEQQHKSFQHELRHINNYDFERYDVNEIEYHSHKEGRLIV